MLRIIILMGLLLIPELLLANDSNKTGYETTHFNNRDSLSVLFVCLHVGQKFMIIKDAKDLTEEVVKRLKYDELYLNRVLRDTEKFWNTFEGKRGENIGSVYWDSNCKHQTRMLRDSFK